MTETAFTRLVGCRLPIQQAAMGGGVAGARLAAAVTDAGGLGMVSALDGVDLGTLPEPFGVGFFGFALVPQLLESAASTARVVEVFWGPPDAEVVQRIHDGGALSMWQCGSPDEVRAAVDAGCDAVVAQGVEAGGHVRGTTPLLDLLASVVGGTTIPVVAAGGLSTAAAVKAALDAGAAAVRVGTAFLAAEEADLHADYLAALLAATGDDTVLTTHFDDGWPDAPHRVLRAALDHAVATGVRSPMPPTSTATGDVSAMAQYAGLGVGDVTGVRPAAQIIASLLS